MRGAVSLAPALAVPVMLANGAPFPQRHLIIFLTYSVILVTLLAQGLSLPRLIRALHVDDGDEEEREENLARLKTAEAALSALDDLAREAGVPKDVTEQMRARYQHRVCDLRNGEDQREARDEAVTHLAKALIAVERKQLIQLRDDEAINDDVLCMIERELDLEHLQLTDSGRPVD